MWLARPAPWPIFLDFHVFFSNFPGFSWVFIDFPPIFIPPKRSRGLVWSSLGNDNAWIELNIQLLQVTVRGRHVTPLETDTCDDGDFKEVLFGGGRKAETVQCAALLSTNLVRVRELLSQPFRITRWEGMAAANLPFCGDYVRLYDMEEGRK